MKLADRLAIDREKDARLVVRISYQLLELCRKQAHAAGVSLAAWVRAVLEQTTGESK